MRVVNSVADLATLAPQFVPELIAVGSDLYISIGQTPGAWVLSGGSKRYIALLSQSGTGTPLATVIKNDLGGTVVWTRTSTGLYIGTLVGAFPLNKVTKLVGNLDPQDNSKFKIQRSGLDSVQLATYNDAAAFSDDLLNITEISIEVRP